MALSRPIFCLVGAYFEQLYMHPLRTKSATSCIIAASANLASQKISNAKQINQESIFAYGLFGLIFGGTLPHYFYKHVEHFIAHAGKAKQFYLFLIERLAYAPLYQAVSLYFLARFEGQTHDYALNALQKLYWPLLKANWRYLSLMVYINVTYIPPMLRVLFGNLIGFFWAIFVANQRRKASAKAAAKTDGGAAGADRA